MKRMILGAIGVLGLTVASVAWGEDIQVLTPDQLVIEKIECVGNERTTCETIQEEVRITAGDKVDESEIANARIRLGLMGLFKESDLALEKGSEPGKVILKIQVKEESPLFADLTVGGIVDNGVFRPGLKTTFGHRNLFGTGKILQGSFQGVKSFNSYLLYNLQDSAASTKVEYVDPHLFGSRRFYLTTGLEYSLHSYEYLLFYVGKRESHFKRVLMPQIGLGYRFGEFSFLHIGYGYDFLGGQWPNKLNTTYGWNSLDDVNFATKGSVFLMNLDWTFGDFAIFDLAGGYRKYWSVGPRSTLSLNLMSTGQNSSAFSGDTRITGASNFNDVPNVGVGYGYDLKQGSPTDNTSGIRRARLTIDAGFKGLGLGYGSHTGFYAVTSPAVRAGLTLDVPSFGTVNLFAMVQKDKHFGGAQ